MRCRVTGDELLWKRDIATKRGVDVATISRALTESRRRLRLGLPLRAGDLPVPLDEDQFYGRPRWRRTPELTVWLTRPGRPARVADQPSTSRKDQP